MNIDVSTNAKDVSRDLIRIFEDQIPFATAKAVNATATDFQAAQRRHQREVFTVRRPTWVDRAVKVRAWAKKDHLEAEVAIDPPGERDDILGKFEEDTKKTPTRGRSVAVPTENVPRTAGGIIPRAWRPSQLFKNPVKYGIAAYFGEKNTMLLRYPNAKRGTIFKVVNKPGANDLVPLYQLVPEVGIQPELDFHANAVKVVSERFEANFAVAFNAAIQTSR